MRFCVPLYLLISAGLVASPVAQACPLGGVYLDISRRSLITQNHIREVPGGMFEALLPQPDETFQIKKFATLDEAVRAVDAAIDSSDTAPLDLEQMILDRAHLLKLIDPPLQAIAKSDPDYGYSSGLKRLASLREKIFDRVAKPKEGLFTLGRLHDIVRAQFTVAKTADILDLANRIKDFPGFTVFAHDIKRVSDGYCAHHVILVSTDQYPVEIQVMTRRTKSWYDWDHDRVYKPDTTNTQAYRDRLKKYSKRIVYYLNRLDDGEAPGDLPDTKGIEPEDVFPVEQLK